MKIRREFAGILYGSAGLIGALALVFFAPVSATSAENDNQVSSWKVARCVFGSDLYMAEIPSSSTDEGDAGCNQCSARSHPPADLFLQSGASENLDSTADQFAPVPTLTRLAPKRSPPPAPLLV